LCPPIRYGRFVQELGEEAIISGEQVTKVPGQVKGGALPVAGTEPTSRESVPERYQYLNPISAGGMGSVHAVRDLGLLRVAAMKVLAPELASRPREVQRFIREAQITAQLDHPNIAPVYEIGVDRLGNRYFTMKRIEGDTLADWCARAGRQAGFSEVLSEMMTAFLKVCDAVAFAHSRGVLHCDIKPGNILAGSFGQVYLVDWGLAIVGATRTMLDTTPSMVVAGDANLDVGGGPCGTPSFMSPEQAMGARHRFDERTDVFGLGAVLYNILTGLPPFDGEDVATCLDRATACVVTFPPGDPTAPLPIGLCRIVKRAMARDPNDRYQTVSELKKDVEMTLRGFPLSAEIFVPGTRIVVEGEPGDCAYIIVRGTCVAYKTVDGQKVVLRRLTAGSVFGETAVLAGGIRTATVEAEDEVLVKVVPRQLLEENLGLHTSFGLFVVALAERFRELDKRLGMGGTAAPGGLTAT
jgi:eukaryotic-like serine/threonine-protein kinase